MLTIDMAGQVGYLQAWKRQKELVTQRENAPELDDYLLLLEHPHTYTIGRHGHMQNLLLDDAALEQRGITVQKVDRGGDITYHGPGQLVGYPILNLERHYGRGIGRIRRYVTDLEQVIMQTIADFDINGFRLEGHPGVWVQTGDEPKKIAAVGVRVTGKGISSHGFALNVDPQMSYFSGIVPCGISQYGVTSMAEGLRRPLSVYDVLPKVVANFCDVFQVEKYSLQERHQMNLASSL